MNRADRSRQQRLCLDAALRRLLEGLGPDRVAVLCIGNAMRGDDGFGPALAETLRGRLAGPVIDGGQAPENELERLCAAGPAIVLLADAVHFGGGPGQLALLEPDRLDGPSISTHSGPLALIARYIRERCGARCAVLAVQPESVELGAPMSDAVAAAVEEAGRLLEELLGGRLRR